MFIYKNIICKYSIVVLNKFDYNQKNYIDNYNIIFYALNGILIWLNIIHINIILIKYSFLILLNNLEYLILKQYNMCRLWI